MQFVKYKEGEWKLQYYKKIPFSLTLIFALVGEGQEHIKCRKSERKYKQILNCVYQIIMKILEIKGKCKTANCVEGCISKEVEQAVDRLKAALKDLKF